PERRSLRSRAADRVELVDEDDRRRRLLGLLEEVAHARGADTDDRLHELRRGAREEGHTRLAGDRARQQRLARTGQPGEEHAARDPTTQPLVLLRVAEEVDDLRQLRLRLVDPCDVAERDLLLAALDAPRARAPEVAQRAHGAAGPAGAPGEEDEEGDQQ